MADALIVCGVWLLALAVVVLAVLTERQWRRRQQIKARLYYIRDGYRYRPARRRQHGAAAIGLLAYLHKTRSK